MHPMIDTHCHLNFEQFHEDLEQVIQRAFDAHVTRIIIPAVDIQTSEESLKLAERYDGIYVAVGVHPNSTKDFTVQTCDHVRELAKHPKVIAIGEIGLDYHWDFSPHDRQHEAFYMQLALAKALELPVIIHNRDAHEDMITILEGWAEDLPESLRTRPGVMHSVSAPLAIAQRALDKEFYLGFTGPVTYKKAEETRRLVAQMPLEKMLVETDAPYLTPEPYRGKRNVPEYIPLIVERIATARMVETAVIARATTENAIRLFQL